MTEASYDPHEHPMEISCKLQTSELELDSEMNKP
jgi:hypothetical protein